MTMWENIVSENIYRKESFHSQQYYTRILQSIYFAFYVGIFSFYSNRMLAAT